MMEPVWRLDWDESLSVGIPDIDAEHRYFSHLINELNEATVGRLALAEIKSRMQAILDDAAAHFAHEEALSAEWGYPDVACYVRQFLRGIVPHSASACCFEFRLVWSKETRDRSPHLISKQTP